MSGYVDDFLPGDIVRLPWGTNNAQGASATRFVDGTVYIYKDADETAFTSITFTDREDHAGHVGSHLYSVDTSSNAGFTPGSDYYAKLVASTIDGKLVNAWIGHWSIANRFSEGLIWKGFALASPDNTHIVFGPGAFATNALRGATIYVLFGAGKGISRVVQSSVGSTGACLVDPVLLTLLDTTSFIRVVASAPAPSGSGSIAANITDARDAALAAQTAAEGVAGDVSDAAIAAAAAQAAAEGAQTAAGAAETASTSAATAATAASSGVSSLSGRIPAALVDGLMPSNMNAINRDTEAAARMAKTTRVICRGTVDAGATTTRVPTSVFTPAGASINQFKGRVVTFDADTVTAALRGQSREITQSSNAALPVISVAQLSQAPVAGDTFSVT